MNVLAAILRMDQGWLLHWVASLFDLAFRWTNSPSET